VSRAVKICRRKVTEKVDQMCLIHSGDQQMIMNISRDVKSQNVSQAPPDSRRGAKHLCAIQSFAVCILPTNEGVGCRDEPSKRPNIESASRGRGFKVGSGSRGLQT